MYLKKQILYALAVYFVFLGMADVLYAQNVAVLIGKERKIYAPALKEFKDVYKGTVKEYFLERAIALTLDYTASQKIMAKLNFADLALVVGDQAARFVQRARLNIPVVFIFVREHEKYTSGKHTCGVFSTPSVRDQLNSLKRVAPNVEKVGVIYDPRRSRKTIDEAESAAGQLNLTIVALPARTKAEVGKAIGELGGKIDAFWMLLDPLVSNKAVFEALLLLTFKEKIPFMVPASAFVKSGGLLSISASPDAIGRQAGRITALMISGAAAHSEIGMQYPEEVELAINLNSAGKIGLAIPEAVLEKAIYVYK